MSTRANSIEAIIAPSVESLGLEVVGIEQLTAPGGVLLRVYIDYPADRDAELPPVGIDECEAASREISAQLDVEDPITSNYTLEVSTPGIERPLFTAEQCARFIGENAKVTLRMPIEGRRRFTGRIASVEGNNVTFEIDGAALTVDFGNVDKAKIAPDWVALGLAPAKGKDGADRRPGKAKKNKPNSRKSHPLHPQSAEELSDSDPE